jgi:hypothetical protein
MSPSRHALCAAASHQIRIIFGMCSHGRSVASRVTSSPSHSAGPITGRFIARVTSKRGGSKSASIRSKSRVGSGGKLDGAPPLCRLAPVALRCRGRRLLTRLRRPTQSRSAVAPLELNVDKSAKRSLSAGPCSPLIPRQSLEVGYGLAHGINLIPFFDRCVN